mmetsp:Transcript_158376/g.485255  ORF Transcript_158376/g.485255 Transcript_158376/m.485255 type:complete len:379 (+) Transcript_158376:38-1174(+)|eukprot:CAMPEP_0204589842 /NCGR_PEP_ID=MMETSP0661-20131031/49438_1 /ASSEMBLY_ACC=CAM_ASM_000606 /TAXON_ID=109239 /ORGANISM="Alexandrium margalefi, Strain AMGDE01CS-322" /LENGTH=378 /DNA_ID=CAMNT_0051599805 /DNA_START=33 /DNA_END=1169 /DNA_ORIENTATION=-
MESEAAQERPHSLLELPAGLWDIALGCLPPADACRLGHTSPTAKTRAHAERIWEAMLQRFFPDACHSRASGAQSSEPSLQRFFDTAIRRLGLACPCDPGCGGTLVVNGAQRCPCVAARTPTLPLRLGSFSRDRCGTSALSGGGFTQLLGLLRRSFAFEHVEMQELEPARVAQLDVLLLCTTEGPRLEEAELAAVRAWVERGGALIVSAFSNWSRFGHYAAETVGWLGLETIPRAGFQNQMIYDLAPTAPGADVTNRLLRGPFGHAKQFANTGESLFRVKHSGFGYGAVRLTPPHDHGCLATLVFYPPRPCSCGGVTGKGRALVCSNYHWLADAEHWNGGLLHYRCRGQAHSSEDGALRPNQALLLNFVAGALAARADR